MVRRNTPLPTDAELEILRVLWHDGACSVRDVHTHLDGATTYTTTLKLLQNMLAKGLVSRDEEQRQHIYFATAKEEATLSALVTRVVQKMFNGSSAALALRALGDGTISRSELGELKRLLRAKELEDRNA